MDLGTLSELTKGVPGMDDDGGRSKRTCVRVREGISRLEEILGDGSSPGEVKPARYVYACTYENKVCRANQANGRQLF